MGLFARLGRAVRRVFRREPAPGPPPSPSAGPTGGGFFDDDPGGVTGPVDNWTIVATWDGPGTKTRYTGPDDLKRLGPGGQVIVQYTDPDTGLVTHRVIHGPFSGDEEDIWQQIQFTTIVVSPP